MYSYKQDIFEMTMEAMLIETKAPEADIKLANNKVSHTDEDISCLNYPVQGIYNIVMHRYASLPV